MRFPFYLLAGGALVLPARAASPRAAAIELYEAKNYPAARPALEKIVADNPRDAEAHYYLGLMAGRRGDGAEAVSQLELATSLDPQNSGYFTELGGAYGAMASSAGMFARLDWAQKCRGALEKAVELDPNNLEARNGLVSYYRAAPSFIGGGMDKAYAQAAEIEKRDPPGGAVILSQLYISEKKNNEAFAVLEKALRASPDNYRTLYALGRACDQTGLRPERATQALRRCLELTPGKGDPSHASVQWRLGNLAQKNHDLAAARAAYEAALQLDPNFTEAKERLAKLK